MVGKEHPENWDNIRTPVLPEETYNHFLALTDQTSRFARYANADARPDNSEVSGFLSSWEDSQPVLEAALNTYAEGNRRFFIVNLPFRLLTDFIETGEELKDRNYPEISAPLDKAITQLDQHVRDCAEVLHSFKTDLYTKNDLVPYTALKALTIITAYSENPDVIGQAVKAMRDVLPEILEKLDTDEPDSRYMTPALQVLRYSSEDHPQIRESIINVLISDSGRQAVGLFSRKYIRQLEPELGNCIKTKYESWNLETDILMDHFNSSYKNPYFARRKSEFRESVIPATLRTISLIESEEPGIAQTLQEEFGINNFFRYPPKMLLRQYEERDDTSKRYGLVWTPVIDEQDWVRGSMDAVENLYDEIEAEYSVRFFEAKRRHGRNGLVRALDTFDKKYNSGTTPHKIDFLINVGHSFLSAPDTIHFGDEWQDNSYLTVGNLSTPRAQLIRNYFEADPDIILVSCKVAKHFRGVVKQLFGGAFYASDELVNRVSKFQITKEEDTGRIRLVPEFVELFEDQDAYENNGIGEM